jgi:hypothetical protein
MMSLYPELHLHRRSYSLLQLQQYPQIINLKRYNVITLERSEHYSQSTHVMIIYVLILESYQQLVKKII